MMEFLARLTELAQKRAPDAARALLARSEAVTATHALLAGGAEVARADDVSAVSW